MKPSKNSSPSQKVNTLHNLKIGSVSILVERVSSPTALQKGLSGRDGLKKNEGMYFDLGERKFAVFHMQGMKFPLDIIWIDKGRVVGFIENASPAENNQIPRFTSPQEITHVLEVNAGFVKENRIQIHDQVVYEN